jgi:hypothetical protein
VIPDEETEPAPEVTPGDVSRPGPETQEGPAAGDLPFTGLDAGLLVVGGLVLLGLGATMRRLSRSSP